MAVEDQRNENDVSLDRFPVGMRVLAVDDDPICLKVLENLLRKCQYQVTMTNQAIKALKMLRENRNKFDLVISDVNMPDMDGFKLLELVGLEMDLPVIMLSAHSDTKLVMKGITHGACDYLLKPVRIEELKNIWQHVVRRRKSESKEQSKSLGHDKACDKAGEGGKGVVLTGSLDQNAKLNRKRKDQDEDEDEEGEDIAHDDEDPAAQKKPRVVWSPDLHKKFVDAVHHLGYDKAFPKKILDVMNVEGLTRENVASHLQKFRQYLKRMSAAESQQANPALGVKGFGDFHTITLSARLANNAPSPSVPHAGILGRLNSPTGLTLRGITSTGLIQPSNSQNMSNSFNSHGKFQPSLPANQNASLFQGIPSAWELNQLKVQQTKFSNQIGETNSLNNGRTGFAVLAGFQDAKATFGGSNNAPSSSSSNLMLQQNPQQTLSRGALGNQSLVRGAPSNPESFDIGISGSSNFLDHNRCTETWQGAVQSSTFASAALPVSESSNHSQMHSNNLVIPSTTSQIGNNPLDFSSPSALLVPLADTRVDVQCQDGLIGNIVQTSNFTSRQTLGGDHSNLSPYFSGINSLNQSLDQNNASCNKNFDASIIDQLNGCTTSAFPSNETEKSTMDTAMMKPNEDYLLGQPKSQDSLIPNSYGSLDDIMEAMMRRDQSETTLMNGDFGFDNFPLGSCI